MLIVPPKYAIGSAVALMDLPVQKINNDPQAVWQGYVIDYVWSRGRSFLLLVVAYQRPGYKYHDTITLALTPSLADATSSDIALWEKHIGHHLDMPDLQLLTKKIALSKKRFENELAKYNALEAEKAAVANLP